MSENKVEHYDRKDKINFVLDRLKAAGIEVVTDKKEFDRILEREKLLQKMAINFSEFEKLEDEKGTITKEATETIKAVTANYGYKPEYSFLRKQVGAVIASIPNIRYEQQKVKDFV